MRSHERTAIIWIIIGAIIASTYGWEVFAGKTSVKNWAFFIAGALLLVGFAIRLFKGPQSEPKPDPKSVYDKLLGTSAGTGACTAFLWIETEGPDYSNCIVLSILLAFCIVLTLLQKKRLRKLEAKKTADGCSGPESENDC